MRLWTVHPCYLDRAGLLACWREALLAQAVLAGKTRGYRQHPQLYRFRQQACPLAAIGSYLQGLTEEAATRGYNFDHSRIMMKDCFSEQLAENSGQLQYEWRHLLSKLKTRAPELYDKQRDILEPLAHSLFKIVPGPVCDWEKQNKLEEICHI